MEYALYDSKYVLPAVGFNNSGAICWFNSMLQMMLSQPAFVSNMLDNAERLKYNKLACAVIELINMLLKLKRLNATANIGRATEHANNIQKLRGEIMQKSPAICEIFRTANMNTHGYLMTGRSEQCASEGYVILLEQLTCDDLNRAFNVAYDITFDCITPGCNKRVTRELRDNRKDVQNFITYNPNRPITTADEFAMWILVHPSICEDYTCEMCATKFKGLIRAEHLICVGEVINILLPKYFIKENTWFPDTFRLPEASGGKFVFTRTSTVHHTGTMTSGHCYANCLRDGKVVKLNDSAESPGTLAPMTNTLMITYHMMKIEAE